MKNIENRITKIEEKISIEPMICRYIDAKGNVVEGSLDQMIRELGNFEKVIRGGNIREGNRLLDYIQETWAEGRCVIV